MKLSVNALRVGYDSVLVRDLTFTLEASCVLALVGPSGVGKTTVLRTLARLMEPLSGTVTLDGRDADAHGFPAWRRRVHACAQRASFFGGTVHEELARAASFRSASEPFDEARARHWLEALGVGDRWDAPVDTLSEGERQRVHLVRSLSVKPDVLLVDEPTSALDPETTAAVERVLMRERDERGLAMVLISHDAAQRARLDAAELELTS